MVEAPWEPTPIIGLESFGISDVTVRDIAVALQEVVFAEVFVALQTTGSFITKR